MKKRIGSKIYDTEKAKCVLPGAGLYKQINRQTYFIYDGDKITPVEYSEAEKMIRESGNIKITQHSTDNKGRAKIGVSPAAADHLAAYCRGRGVTQKSVIEEFIYSLPLFNKDVADRDRQEVDGPEN